MRLQFLRSLSARLLVLTVFFVMLAELFIYAPSIARFRAAYLTDRLAYAHTAALVLQAAPTHAVDPELETRLLSHIPAHGVELMLGPRATLMLGESMPPRVDLTVEMGRTAFFPLIWDAVGTLVQNRNRVLHVTGPSPTDPDVTVDLTMDEWPMRRAMLHYSGRILTLSVFISVLTAMLVFLTLRWLMVRPMAQLTAAMIRFGDEPENQNAIVRPSRRADEIGRAERELASMQHALRVTLGQRAHLAALGEAVAKINHDLRNILGSAQLVSDSLADSDDPRVRQTAPTLVRAIDRAVGLCARLVEFARAGAPDLVLRPVDLGALIADVAETAGSGIVRFDRAGQGLFVEADREQLFRVFANLIGNAVEAGADRIDIEAEQGAGRVAVTLSDNGPGLARVALDNLFRPFRGSTKPDGSGLGLALAREIMHAHGAGIELVSSDPTGTVFRLDLAEGEGAA